MALTQASPGVVLRPARPGALSAVAIVAGVVVAAVLLGQLVRPPAAPTTLLVPPRGQAAAVWLGDTPVWVSNGPSEVSVLSAVNPAPLFGLQQLVGWCASSGLLSSYWDGSQFDPGGRYVSGPALHDLDRYEVVPAGDGSSVRVGQRFTPDRRSVGNAPPPGSRDCLTAATAAGPLTRYHVSRDRGFDVLGGYLVFRDAGPAKFCHALAGEATPRCPAGTSLVVPQADAGLDSDDWLVLAGRVMARVDDDQLLDVYVLPVGRIQRDPDH